MRADGSDCGREENKDAKLDGEERLLVVHLLLLLLLCEGIVITLWSARWLAGDPASLLSESAIDVSMVLYMRASPPTHLRAPMLPKLSMPLSSRFANMLANAGLMSSRVLTAGIVFSLVAAGGADCEC